MKFATARQFEALGLSPGQVRVIVLTAVRGKSDAQAAKMLKISTGALRQRRYHARCRCPRLREVIDQQTVEQDVVDAAEAVALEQQILELAAQSKQRQADAELAAQNYRAAETALYESETRLRLATSQSNGADHSLLAGRGRLHALRRNPRLFDVPPAPVASPTPAVFVPMGGRGARLSVH